jgi:hypothetical protein
MQKIDFKKELIHLYNASAGEVTLVNVPRMNFLMVDGMGDPNSSTDFKNAIEALYSLSYSLKFTIKKRGTADYLVMPLEGKWWAGDMGKLNLKEKESWKWTLMIMQPEYITDELFRAALIKVGEKKELEALSKVRFENFHEGLSVQIMHIGQYSMEGPAIKMMHDYIRERDHEFFGKHHEVYLNNPERTAPEKLKTILRQPIRRL